MDILKTMALKFGRMIPLWCVLIAWASTPGGAYTDMYPQDELLKDWQRLKKAVTGIYQKGFEPFMTAKERRALQDVELRFELPQDGDDLLNFYATFEAGRPVVVLPVLSLKVMEDVTTAFAWLYHNNLDLSKIELYFTMTRFRQRGGRFPAILPALGVPPNALKDKRVDDLSLRLRNEAFAFILAHELGHIYYRHRGYADITKEQARADEIQSDRFALDLMGRTKTPPMGPFLFFQSQVYRFPHRGEFRSDREWSKYLRSVSTHPMSTERIDVIATYAKSLARTRRSESQIWDFVGRGLEKIGRDLEDLDLQRCLSKVARNVGFEVLKPSRTFDRQIMLEHCRTL